MVEPSPEFKVGVEWYLTMIFNAYTKGKGKLPPLTMKVGKAVWEEYNRVISMPKPSSLAGLPINYHVKMILNPNAVNPYDVHIVEGVE